MYYYDNRLYVYILSNIRMNVCLFRFSNTKINNSSRKKKLTKLKLDLDLYIHLKVNCTAKHNTDLRKGGSSMQQFLR